MKITLRLIISLLIGTAFVVVVFSYFQVKGEEKRLDEELRLRAAVLAKSFKEAVEPLLELTEQPSRIRKFIEKFQGHKRLVGVIVDLPEIGRFTLPPELGENGLFRDELKKVVEQAQPFETQGKWGRKNTHLYAVPLIKGDAIAGSLGLIHDRHSPSDVKLG